MKHRAAWFLASLLVVHSAAGQPVDDRTRSAARALAQEGVSALQGGDAASAADKLERAYQLIKLPAVGLWSARALEKSGKLVAAAERYLELTRWSGTGPDARVQDQAKADAAKERDLLLPRIPSVTVVVAGAPASEVQVTLDGEAVPGALLGSPQPVDPGRHLARGARGNDVVTKTVALSEGASETLRLEFTAASAAPPPPMAGPVAPGASPPPAAQGSPVPADAPADTAPSSSQRTVGLVIGGVGVVGLGVAGVFTLQALSKKSKSQDFCDGGACRTPEGVALLDDARSAGNVATITGLAGVALLGTGAVLFFTAPSGGSSAFGVSPRAYAGGAGLTAQGAF